MQRPCHKVSESLVEEPPAFPEKQTVAFAASVAILTTRSREPRSLALASVDVISSPAVDFGVGSAVGDEFDRSDPTECLREAGDRMMSIPLEEKAASSG